MRRKLKITPYDVVDYLTDEESIRMYIAEVRNIGMEKNVERAIEEGKRACARYGLSLAAAGLAEDETTPLNSRFPQKSLTFPAASPILVE